MENKVIITADDYGVCDRIDQAIIKAVRAKKLTSISAIVTHESSRERIEKLIPIQKEMVEKGHNFGIGLHFCITSGLLDSKEGEKKSSLADPDDPSHFREVLYYPFSKIKMWDLKKELDRQFDLMSRIIGMENIDHLTNHHGIVYFDKNMFEQYVGAAARHKAPIRSPMSWYRKFGKVEELPDYDEHFLGNPTMRRGISLGMWRKLAQMSYGNLLKRMERAEELAVDYPDVLCEYIYGQASTQIDKGEEVIAHALHQYIDPGFKKTKEKREGMEILPDRMGIFRSNQYTVKKGLMGKKDKFAQVVKRYASKNYVNDFSIELMFHLADPMLSRIDEGDLHGINKDYFPTRDREYLALDQFDLETFKNQLDLHYVNFKQL